MTAFTLDAGALIAADRGDVRFWDFSRKLEDRFEVITVPTAVLTQVRRGARNANLARALKGCELEHLDPELALAAGMLCGQAGTDDAVDAIVVASAARRGDHIVTTDPEDLRALADAARGVGKILDLNTL
jgi:predicted nucleic acid-binding protein